MILHSQPCLVKLGRVNLPKSSPNQVFPAMIILFLKETLSFEKRTSITPNLVEKYQKLGFDIFIESSIGLNCLISDESFEKAGAKIVSDINEALALSDIIVSVQRHDFDYKKTKSGALFISLLNPYSNQQLITKLTESDIKPLALEMIPRITRAQSMDVLSSQSNLAGYRAVIDAVYQLNKAVPMMMTAAGTVSAARFLILGVGVAGLQAIATAKRLGGIVTAFDVRAAAKEQVQSLGAKFLEVDSKEKVDGVYAKEMSEEYKKKQEALLLETIKNQDVVITTALIPGKKAPILITKEMVYSMKAGSVIVDLASLNGGNCALTKAGEVLEIKGVQIIGYENFASRVALDASSLFSRNIFNLVELITKSNQNNQSGPGIELDLDDEIIRTILCKG